MIWLISLSIALQAFAAYLALVQARKVSGLLAWGILSGGFLLMAVRRLITLIRVLQGPDILLDPLAESVALGISILMVAGIWLIGGVFARLNAVREEAQQELDRRMEAEHRLVQKDLLLLEMEKIARIGGWELDTATGQVTWTDGIFRIHDLEATEGVPLEEGLSFYPESSRPIIEQSVRETISAGTPYDLELEFVSAKGVKKWVRTNGRPVYEDGRVVKVRGAFQDITALKVSEEAYQKLSGRQRQLAEILDGSEQPFGLGYPDGHLGMCNAAFCELTGYTMTELQSVDWNDVLTPPEWREPEQQALEKLIQTRKPVRYQKEYIRKDGKRVPIEMLAQVSVDAEGLPRFFYAFITDITERLRAETEIRKYQNHLEELAQERAEELAEVNRISATILDTAPVGIATYAEDGQCVNVNGSVLDLLGGTREQLLAQNFNQIDSWQEGGLVRIARECLSTGEGRQLTASLSTTFGKRIILDLRFARIFLQGRHHLLVILHDITERVQQEQALQGFTRELESANRELEAFSYSVSHDLRSPLRSIDGFSQALLEDFGEQLDQAGLEHLQRIRASAQRMGTLINDLLQLSRISRWELKSVPLDLRVMAGQVVILLREQDPARALKAKIGPHLQMTGDPRLMRLVLDNLIGNAWKFSKNEAVSCIEVGKARNKDLKYPHPDLPDDRMVFFVKDNGVGYDMQYADKLFSAFQRLHTQAEFEGTGIGLATVKRAIERQGGCVWGGSQEGEGTLMCFAPEPRISLSAAVADSDVLNSALSTPTKESPDE